MNIVLARLPLLILVLIRVSGLIAAAPILSNEMIGAKVKIFFALAFSVMLAAILPAPAETPSMLSWIMTASGEFLIGAVLGFGYRIAFSAASVAGEILGLQMGFDASALMDPNTEQVGSSLEQLYSVVFMTVFVSLNGHHQMLRAFKDSYGILPLQRSVLLPESMELLALQSARMLECGVRMAAPVVLPLFLLSFAVALLSRACPQMNVWSLSNSLSILVGLVLLVATLPAVTPMVQELIRDMDKFAHGIMQAMAR